MGIIKDAPAVQTHLEAMGLPISLLVRAVNAGGGGFNATTGFHPKSGPGTYLYQEATAGLRRGLSGKGDWTYDEEDRQPRTYSVDRGVSIVVQTGDENTGVDTGIEPKPRNPKGVATLKKVSSNVNQLTLFNMAPKALPQARSGEVLTWILLIAVIDDVVRSELSLPRKWSSDGRPCGWLVRILLEEQPLGRARTVDLEDPDSHLETDISVAWKQ